MVDAPTETETARESGASRLAVFYARRRRALPVMVSASFSQAVMLGSSTLVVAIDDHFSPTHSRDGHRSYVFNGVYSFALNCFVQFFIAGCILTPTFQRYPEKRRSVSLFLVGLQPLGWALAGLATSWNHNVGLLYFSITFVIAANNAIFDFIYRVEAMLWFSIDNTKHVGVGAIGLGTGSGAVFYTLLSGWIIHYGSLETYLYTLAGFQALTSLPVVLAVYLGWLDAPPTKDEFDAWNAEAAAPPVGDAAARVPRKPVEAAARVEEKTAPSSSLRSLSEELAKPRPSASARPEAGGSLMMPMKLKNWEEALQFPILWNRIIIFTLSTFNGYCVKVLLSTTFVLIFSLGELTAAYLSAATLSFYLIGRAAVPFLFLDRKGGLPAVGLFTIAAGMATVSYGVIPSIIGTGEFAKPRFSWRLLLFCFAKAFAGLSFAAMQTLSGPLLVNDFGGANFVRLAPLLYPSAGTGGGLGPIAGILIVYAQYYRNNKTFAEAFGTFFYIAAALSFIVFSLTAYSWILLRKEERRIAALDGAKV